MPQRIAVLASGAGTNLQAIMDFHERRQSGSAGVIALVAANRASAGALQRSRDAGIPSEAFDASDDGTALLELLELHSIDLVVLAGYLKRIPATVISRFSGRIVNVHRPSP